MLRKILYLQEAIYLNLNHTAMYKLFALILFMSLSAYQQGTNKKGIAPTYKALIDGSWVETKLDAEPILNSDTLGMDKVIMKNLRYPVTAQRARVSGEVLITAEITENGEIINEKIVKDPGHGLGEEALRVVKLIPDNFTPATLNGQPVRAQVTIPLTFKLMR
jgi:TonB family protein